MAAARSVPSMPGTQHLDHLTPPRRHRHRVPFAVAVAVAVAVTVAATVAAAISV